MDLVRSEFSTCCVLYAQMYPTYLNTLYLCVLWHVYTYFFTPIFILLWMHSRTVYLLYTHCTYYVLSYVIYHRCVYGNNSVFFFIIIISTAVQHNRNSNIIMLLLLLLFYLFFAFDKIMYMCVRMCACRIELHVLYALGYMDMTYV